MKKKFALMLALNLAFGALVFMACAGKDEAQTTAALQRQVLMYAQKVKFRQNGENGVFVLSYLNPVFDDESDKDIFVLAVSPKESDIKALRAFMDSNEAVIAPLDENSTLKNYLIKSDYAKYYALEFPFKDASVIAVKLCLDATCFELSFQKYSKSLYFRSEDVDTLYN